MNLPRFYDYISHRLIHMNFIPLLLTRFTIAGVFMGSGMGKLNHLERTINYFASLGMPFPSIITPIVAAVEVICGCAILLGLVTRLAAIPLIGVMLVAIRTAKWDEFTGFSALFGMSEYLYIVLLVWLVIQGPGRISVDYIIKKPSI